MTTGTLTRPLTQLARGLAVLQAPFALGTRLYVGWVFLKSGWWKLTNWDQTVPLFETEYKVPLLSPTLAAIMGTFGELFFPVLLILGLAGRVGALGTFFVNIMAVVSYYHVLGQEGSEAGLWQHYLWGFMLAMLAIYGTGAISLDRLLANRTRAERNWD